MSDPVTLTVWRDATTDPPDGDRLVLTDGLEFAFYDADRAPPWTRDDGIYADEDQPLDPPPRLWCDPQAPGDDAPTLQDVANVTAAATYLVRYVPSDDPNEVAEMAASAARLRAALDALDRKDTP